LGDPVVLGGLVNLGALVPLVFFLLLLGEIVSTAPLPFDFPEISQPWSLSCFEDLLLVPFLEGHGTDGEDDGIELGLGDLVLLKGGI
jgi:hypothetical protein